MPSIPMIYFIQDSYSKAVKIGHGREPEKRLTACQTGTPYPLIMLGTLPGGPLEEAILHDQFEPFHLRGEWFKGEDDFLAMIRLMLFAKGRPSTVWDEARRRGGCRSGLRGVTIGIFGYPTPWKIHHSRWGKDRTLLLGIYEASDPAPYHHWVGPMTPEEQRSLEIGLIRGDWVGTKWVEDLPASFIPDMEAERCVLLSEWPVVCCEPNQRIEDWNK